MNNKIDIQTGNLYAEHVGAEGVTRDELASLAAECANAHRQLAERSRGGLDADYACLNLAQEMPGSLTEIRAVIDTLRGFQDVVVIGIGGSSLGAKAVCQAAAHKLKTDPPRLRFVENVDPYSLHRLLMQLDATRTAVVCISKSGGTIETVVQFLILRDWLVQHLGQDAARRRQWVITDPHGGWLRELAVREQLPSLPVPPKVGGRYSVLSAVGLVPLGVAGIDIDALLAGGADHAVRCQSDQVESNAALEIAALCYLLDTCHGKHLSVMMPYVNRMRLFGDWYRQLWAESLGKWYPGRAGRAAAGTLPLTAVGAIDQHSQLQMYLESRHDKFFTFIELLHWEHDMPIPVTDDDARAFPYLQGKSMADVIDAEFRATRQVITAAGHPNMTIALPALDAYVFGELLDLYQRTTVYAGLLYGINPLDQPSVEKGKVLAVNYLRDGGH
jgi:glucose-6-phosphate isomerase